MLATMKHGFTQSLTGPLVLVLLMAVLYPVDPAIAQGLDAGVVKLVVTKHDGTRRVGSGFIVRIDNDWAYVVTAAHVVEGGRETGVVFISRRLAKPVPAEVVHQQYWDRRGLALLRVSADGARIAGVRALTWSETGAPAKGQEVLVIGHPRTISDWAHLHGWVTGREGETLKVQASGVNEGSSGGPVLHKGKVAGVVVEEESGIAIVKPVVNIRNYLEGHGLAPPAPPVAEAPEPARPTVPKKPLKPAKLTVRSNVTGDMVYIDGERRGPTRLDLELVPGAHLVRVEKGGYEPFETEIELSPGGSKTLRARLERAVPQPGETFRDCDDCPEMVVIPAGTFRMGSPNDEKGRSDDEGPVHSVSFDRPFAMAKHEITFEQWDACVRDGGCSHKPDDKGWGRDQRPVINVSWEDARKYLKWLSKKTGESYRLPSEAEWEYAARAGATTARFWGDDPDAACRYANVHDETGKRKNGFSWTHHACDDGYAKTAPAGSFEANGFGLRDMLGNVWEWTQDCWDEDYEGAPDNGSAWTEGDCRRRVLRGGSWVNEPDYVRSAFRNGSNAGNRYDDLGFRPARTL